VNSLLIHAANWLITLTCHSTLDALNSQHYRSLFSYTHPIIQPSPTLNPQMPNPISSNATLHALTERLALHSRTLSPFSFATDRLAAYRQPAPPPQLPILQLSPRHQDVPQGHLVENGAITNGKGSVGCPAGNRYSVSGEHTEKRCSKCEDEELNEFMVDMGLVMRREYDCWVEQCW